ncbi:MAG: groS [Proteobacteria bacterium]|nr:groS [Pseudomonadota bacterium]
MACKANAHAPRAAQKRGAEHEVPSPARQEKPQQGEVIAVGPGARNEKGELVALDVKAGDKVLFGKWSGTEVKIDGQDLLIMKESDVMGIVG